MILDEIIRKTKEDLEKRKKEYDVEWLGRSLAYNPYPPRDVKPLLTSTQDEPVRIIAEVKKASPSKVVLNSIDYDDRNYALDFEPKEDINISVQKELARMRKKKDY